MAPIDIGVPIEKSFEYLLIYIGIIFTLNHYD